MLLFANKLKQYILQKKEHVYVTWGSHVTSLLIKCSPKSRLSHYLYVSFVLAIVNDALRYDLRDSRLASY